MKKSPKQAAFETEFSDNFKPNWYQKIIMKYELYRDDVIVSLIPNKGKVVVDVPCGDGLLLAKVADRFDTLIGLDISTVRLKNAAKNLSAHARKLELQQHDVDTGLPFASNSVDVLTCNASIGCFVHPELFLDEVNRVLKKDGVFILQIGNYAFLLRRLALLFGYLPKISAFTGFGDGGMLHYFTYDSLAELLRQHNLVVTKTSNSGLLASVRKIWPSLLASDIIYQAVKA
jgi:ubiquinone/menaquinone biosynthesis C-methylase UbiE